MLVATALRAAAVVFWLLLASRSAWALLRYRIPGEPFGPLLVDRVERDGPRLALLALAAAISFALFRFFREGARPSRPGNLPLFAALALLAALPGRRWVLGKLAPALRFEDATERLGLGAPSDLVEDVFGAACADIDGDGDLDLLLNHHNLHDLALLRNEGGNGFQDVAEEAGLLGEFPLRALLGKPESPPPEGGFDLSHDPPRGESEPGNWRVRWRAGERPRRFEGTVETNGPILPGSVTGVNWELGGDGRSVRFDSGGPVAGGILEFATKYLEGTYRFDLRVDGRADPSLVRVGPRGLVPREMPLWIALGDPHGTAFGDADGDGDADLFVTHGAMTGELRPPTEAKADPFFRNEGGRFREEAAAAGLLNPYGRGRCAAWLDLDRDGSLDLFVGNLRQPALFFRGSPEGRFTEEAAKWGLALDHASAFRWFDADEDGDLDLLALAPLALHRNEAGRFEEVLDAMGLPRGAFAQAAEGGLFVDVSASFADVDGDGDQDLYLAGPESAASGLYERDGAAFRDATARSGLPRGARQAAFSDYDDDGLVDVYLVMRTSPNRLFHNEGGGRFAGRTRALGVALDGSVGRTALWLDADRSPGLDLLVLNRIARRPWDAFFDPLGPHRLFLNHASRPNRSIEVVLRSRRGGAGGLGARIRVATAQGEQVQVAGDRWFSVYGQSLAPMHFGIGAADGAQAVEVAWPSGGRSIRLNVAAFERVEIEEP